MGLIPFPAQVPWSDLARVRSQEAPPTQTFLQYLSSLDSNTRNVINGQIPGTTTGDDALPGNVGEYKSSLVPFFATVPSAMALLSSPPGQWYNITSISLTAGDWNVSGFGAFNQDGIGNIGGTTAVNILASAISAVSADPVDYTSFAEFSGNGQNIFLTANIPTLALPLKRFSLSAPQTVYLNSFVFVSGGPCYGGGFISARRAR